MKSIILGLFILMSQPLRAQWRLIYKSGDIDSIWVANKTASINTSNPITSIERRGELSRFLIVRYAHSKRQLVATKDVWGFTDSTNTVWRYFGGDLCRVVNYNGAGVEYAIYRTFSRLRTNRPEVYYTPGYSRTLDSKIETTWEKAMEDIPSGHILWKKSN